MRVGVLGALTVGGAPTCPPTVRRLVALLAVHAGEVVSADRIAEVLWGTTPPRHPDAAVHSLVARTRAALGEPSPITRRAPGYLLRLAPGELDADRFAALVRSGADADPGERAARLDEALGLWRGPAYAEFADEDFARPEVGRLGELRAVAEEDRAEAELACGRTAAAVAHLDLVVAAHPLRERPSCLLARALHRAGRPAEALAVLRAHRDRLRDELGLDPGSTLRLVEAEVLASPPASAPSVDGAEHRSAHTPVRRPRRADPSDLVGRDTVVDEVVATLLPGTVLTLTGPGGVGKTRLARYAAALATRADGDGDGAVVAELAALGAGDDPAGLVATVLGVPAAASGDPRDRVVEHLAGRSRLLVLDNCEHVLGGVARLVEALTAHCPGVTVLATSREPLGASGERVRPVPPLAVPRGRPPADRFATVPAVALFVARARAATSDFALTDANAAAVAALCRRLDGLPLALELAAARMRVTSPAELAEQLPSRLRFLRSPARTAEDRHRTLHAVVDWSHRLLTPHQQRALARLSVFAGSFTADAAAGVLDRPFDAAEVLAELADRSLLTVTVEASGAGPARYALLETIRAFARERLAELGEALAASRAHAERTLAVARAAAALHGPESVRRLRTLDAEGDELRAAVTWSIEHAPELATSLVAALVDLVDVRMPPEVFAWADTVLAVGHGPDLARVHAVAAAGARFAGDLPRARDLVARGLARTADDDPGRRHLHYVHSEVAMFSGRLDDALDASRAAGRLARTVGDERCTTLADAVSVLEASYRGRHDEARALADDLLARPSVRRDPLLVGWGSYLAGEVRVAVDPDAASARFDAALRAARAVGDAYLLGVTLVSAASVRARHGDPARAAALAGEALAHWRSCGNRTHLWVGVRHLVELLVRVGDDAAAAELLGGLSVRREVVTYGSDAATLDGLGADLTVRLGPAAAAARGRGAAMTDEELLDRVHDLLDALSAGPPQRAGRQGTGSGPAGRAPTMSP